MAVLSASLRRDLRLATRGDGAATALMFFLLLVIFFPLGLGARLDLIGLLGPSLLWAALLLSLLLSMSGWLRDDFEDGSLEAMRVVAPSLRWIVLCRGLSHFLSAVVPLAAASPVAGMLLGLDARSFPWIAAAFLSAGPGLVLMGSLGSALTIAAPRGALPAVLLTLPFYVPTLIFGAAVIEASLAAAPTVSPHRLLAVVGGMSILAIVFAPSATAAILDEQSGWASEPG